MKKFKILSLVLTILTECFLSSCTKDKELSTAPSTPFELRMTDAIGSYDAVNIDVKEVEVKTNSGSTVMLNVNSGIYNLLDYANGNDTILATGIIPTATVSQVRLILGNNNSVVVNGVNYPMNTPSAQESGLKLQVHAVLQPGIKYLMLIDFDADRSIVTTGSGEYQLKPVIRVITQPASGSIHGIVAPAPALPATVLAVNGADTVSTSTDAAGDFLFQGMAAGTYSIIIQPRAPYHVSVTSNVNVTVGTLTELGTITVI